MKNRPYQICTHCVMDTTDSEIVFDSQGVCNHCNDYKKYAGSVRKTDTENDKILNEIVSSIKLDGVGKRYDCITGLSGGVDSSYLVYMLKRLGLRVLVVHLDNGWNNEMAVKNIENLTQKLNFDLYTNVLDWEEFKSLQVSYLKSSVLDLEALTDHAIFATLVKMANKFGVKHIVNGGNSSSESILPETWRYSNKLTDNINVIDINKRFGTKKIKNFPLLSISQFRYYMYIKKMKIHNLLNFMGYDKQKAKEVLMQELDWKDYGGKHYESVITRFYQGYILPVKFGIDKRKAHLSSLINSGQMTRDKALEILKQPILEDEILKNDIEYVPKKLGLSNEEFQEIMALQPRKHEDFKTNYFWRDMFKRK